MKHTIKISFLEREYFAGDNTKTTMAGYELARIKMQGAPEQIGRVINVDKLKKAEFIDTIFFSRELPLKNSEIDLAKILENDENGSKWLASFRGYFSKLYEQEAPTLLSIKTFGLKESSIEPPPVKYTWYPNYMEKIKNDRSYFPPEGILNLSEVDAVYCDILPPMKLANGERAPNLYYNIKAMAVNGTIGSYSMRYLHEPRLPTQGILLGKLRENDVKDPQGNFENGFPLVHYLEICYPTPLRQAAEINPLTINVELCEKTKDTSESRASP